MLIQDASGCEIQRDFTIIEPEEISDDCSYKCYRL